MQKLGTVYGSMGEIFESLQKENKPKTPKEHRPFDAYAEPEIKGKIIAVLSLAHSSLATLKESNPENNFTQEEATPKQNKKAERVAKKAERKATRKTAKAQKKEAQIKKKRGQEDQKENTEQMPVVEETTSMSEAFQKQPEGEVSENA